MGLTYIGRCIRKTFKCLITNYWTMKQLDLESAWYKYFKPSTLYPYSKCLYQKKCREYYINCFVYEGNNGWIKFDNYYFLLY